MKQSTPKSRTKRDRSVSAADGSLKSTETVYCPYTDRDIPIAESNREHIIPLALGGLNTFTLRVSKEFNSRLGSQIDGALANDFLVMTKRDKHLVRGHSHKDPEYAVKKAYDTKSRDPLKLTMGQRRGLRIWSPKDKRDLTGLGKTISMQIDLDIDIPLRFVAKTALSAGYAIYGDLFRAAVKHDEFRTIMNYRPTDIGDAIYGMEARFDHWFREPETDKARILRAMCAAVGPTSLVALIPGPRNLGVVVGILGDFLGMINVPADTSSFPNDGDFRMGQVIVLNKPRGGRLSFLEMMEKMRGKG